MRVTFFLRDQSTPEQLLAHADEAMLTAKREGKSRNHY
jgi:PleD family two-component response regulator